MTITKGNTMRARVYAVLIAMAVMACGWFHCAAAHANPVCPFPTTNAQLEIRIVASGGGLYCVYPKEYTGANYWCHEGGGGIGVNFGGNSNGFGGGASGGIGADYGDCAPRCPDGRIAFQPNPPGWWKYHIRKYLDCLPIDPDSVPGAPPPDGPLPVDPRPIPPGMIDSTGAGDDSAQTGVSAIDPIRGNPASLSPRGR